MGEKIKQLNFLRLMVLNTVSEIDYLKFYLTFNLSRRGIYFLFLSFYQNLLSFYDHDQKDELNRVS